MSLVTFDSWQGKIVVGLQPYAGNVELEDYSVYYGIELCLFIQWYSNNL